MARPGVSEGTRVSEAHPSRVPDRSGDDPVPSSDQGDTGRNK